MRTVTEIFNVYNYNELSEEAKEKVKEWYLDDDFRTVIFSDNCNEDRSRYFRYAFVVNFCGEDFDEFRYDEDENIYYNYKPKDYADELAYSFIDSYNSTYENHDNLFEDCKNTIEKYNRRVSADYDNSTIWGMACEIARTAFGDVGSRKFVAV